MVLHHSHNCRVGHLEPDRAVHGVPGAPNGTIKNGKATELLRPHRTFEGPCTFEILLSSHGGPQTK